jgi:glycosyltransferase involved in cell wall biosynthesis
VTTGRRARVLVVHPGAELYGSDRILLESVEAFVARGWGVTVVLPAAGPLGIEVERVGASLRLCPAPVLRKSFVRPAGLVRLAGKVVTAVPRLRRLVRDVDPDVVYVSTLTTPLWIAVARATRRPVLCHVHEAEASARKLLRRALAAPLLLANRVVANSRFSADVLADAVPRLAGRTTVVYNGVRGPDTVAPARQRLEGDVRMLYVGRLSPRKGPQVVLEALAELTEQGVPARLELLGSVFAGYEWFADELHEFVDRHGLGDRVRFLGFRPSVWPVLAEADIALIPSTLDEPFGNTAVEAALAARPVVVSDTSGLREASDGLGAAVLVSPGDPAALAAAVRQLVGDWPAARAHALADAATTADRYAPARYQTEIADAVAGLLPAGSARAGDARSRRREPAVIPGGNPA